MCITLSLLPTWTFGLWLSTSFLTSYDSETVSGFLQGMKDRDCGVRVFHLDCFWMKGYEWFALHLHSPIFAFLMFSSEGALSPSILITSLILNHTSRTSRKSMVSRSVYGVRHVYRFPSIHSHCLQSIPIFHNSRQSSRKLCKAAISSNEGMVCHGSSLSVPQLHD